MAPCEHLQSSTVRVVFTFSRRYVSPHGSVGVWTLRQHAHPNMGGPHRDDEVGSFREMSKHVSRNKSQPLPCQGLHQRAMSLRQGQKEEQEEGISWIYKEIHGRSAIGKGNLSAKKDLVAGKWEQVHTQQFMQRILTTIWNKHFEFALKVKLGETANKKKQCRQIKNVLEQIF